MDFSGITGQKEITGALEAAIYKGKVGHAYIFHGSKGIGKKTVARIFSGMLLCSNKISGASNPLDFGISLRDISPDKTSGQLLGNGSNPDFFEINPEGASIGVDEIRKIHSDIIIRPLYSDRKVYLIIDAERMTTQAQNSLLKTLEEPPGYSVIILTVNSYGSLLETIRSRAVRYGFKKNSYNEVRDHLASRFGNNLAATGFIASYADGVIGKALEMADSEDFIALREKTIETVLKLKKSKLSEVFRIYGFFEENKSHIDTILDIMLLYYRDLLAFKNTGAENILINSDKKDIILNNALVYTTYKLIKDIETIELTRKNIKLNANYQLSIEVMLMKLQEEDG